MKLIENCRIIEKSNKGIIIEIDSEENNDLLIDLTNKFFITRFSQRRVENKVGHGYVIGNLFTTLMIHHGCKMEFERVKKLQFLSARYVFYRLLNFSNHFKYNYWYYCSYKKFYGCEFPNGEEFYCFICQIHIKYGNPDKIEKMRKLSETINLYLRSKNALNLNQLFAIFGLFITDQHGEV